MFLSAAQHQQLLWVSILKSELAVKACAVGGHQIHPFHSNNGWGVQELFQNTSTKAMALQVAGDNDVPQHCATESIGCSATKANEAFPAPETDHRITACKQSAQLREAAAPGPESMAIE